MAWATSHPPENRGQIGRRGNDQMGTRPLQFVLFAEAAENADGPGAGLTGGAHIYRGIAYHRAAVGRKV